MDNFDVHEWNKNRYLKRIEENKSYLDQLASDLSSKYPNLDFYVSDHTDRIDVVGSEQDKFNFGDKFHGKKFGEYEVFAIDDDDRGEVVRIVKSSSISRGKLEESYMYKGYKDKHFDICPAAEGLRDRLLSGEFKNQVRDKNLATPTEVGEWLYQHDVLFKTEKQILRDKEGDESDIEKAKVAIGRIINLSRDLGIPSAEISYLKSHLKKITDIVEYSSLTESTLCKRGQEYIKARKATGEKSSAYLSGRAVKVCKGDIKFKGKKQKDFKNESLDEYVDNGPEEKSFDVEMEKAGNGIASAIEKELKNKKSQELNEAIITSVIAGILTGNSLIGFISKLSKLLFKKIGFKKGEDIAGKIQHWAHDNEIAFQKPIRRVLGFFIKDTKTLDIVTKGIYAIVVGSMAANYGAEAVSSLSKSDWFASSLNALKTLAKSDETIVNAYPAIKSLI
ncbi:hypothetical protein N9Z41_00075 [bacterium]|nr:hypothetical protein [bacterium]